MAARGSSSLSSSKKPTKYGVFGMTHNDIKAFIFLIWTIRDLKKIWAKL
jgi:hypothetical protein